MDQPGKIDLAILGAVSQEIASLSRVLQHARAFTFLGESFFCGTYGEKCILAGTTGIGKVNAAITTTAILQRFHIQELWNIGSAGAESHGPLQVGDVLITREALCGDEGVLTKESRLSSKVIGIPILAQNGHEYYESLTLDRTTIYRHFENRTPPALYHCQEGDPPAAALSKAGARTEAFHLWYGPSLTVGMASGDMATAGNRFQQHGAFAENMEGSAVALACLRFDIPIMECRGISNIVGDRRKDNWQMEKAIHHCHSIVMRTLWSTL
jgi:futalosine hydrolase